MKFSSFLYIISKVTNGKTIFLIFTLVIYFKFFNKEFIKNEPQINGIDGIVDNSEYSFLVAGHTYGSHHHFNEGIYPKFLSRVQEEITYKDEFLLITRIFDNRVKAFISHILMANKDVEHYSYRIGK